MPKKYVDDEFTSLDRDVDKMRMRFRQYISFSNEQGAKAVADEILSNALDECISPRSPGNKIHIEFDERTGFILVEDNGRGIPTEIMEKLFTTLNSGSNIITSNKASLKTETLGQNGVGTLAIAALAERAEITSYRGGTEDIYKTLIFEEGNKVSENTGKCNSDKHGLRVLYKPSVVLGKKTRIIWSQIRNELLDWQYLNKKKINIDSIYYDKNGKETVEKYKLAPFQDILLRNEKDKLISSRYCITIDADDLVEDLSGTSVKRYLSMDVAFVYTTSLTPYIDSFTNNHNNPDNGDHLDGAIEALCRFLQSATKNSLGDKEKDKLDIKWDDVKSGLSIAVSLRTNYERLYTGQTKHKVVSQEIKAIIISKLSEAFTTYFSGKNAASLKELINIVKTNARARREGDKVKQAVVKNSMTNWSQYKMKNFDPCTAKGKEYAELYLIEGD